MEQDERRHGKGGPMADDAALTHVFGVLDRLSHIAQAMHPRRLDALVATLDDREVNAESEQIALAARFASRACAGLRAAPLADNPMLEAYRALRQYSRALEALAALADADPRVGLYFLERRFRDDPAVQQRLAGPAHPDTGIFHSANETTERGGFSVYVPPFYNPATPMPVVMALHGGSGHGRLFLWNWLPEARARGLIVIAPTAIGGTWSLMEPEIDAGNLNAILTRVRDRWTIDATHMLLTGMSDGGTFTLLSGVSDDSPFTHLAPVAGSFHPFLLAMTTPERLTGLPIHLTHGALDWMFPVNMARTAYRTLKGAGAAITYREIPDLSHAYPRDGQGEVVDWWLPGMQ
jgi:phospholipase/carboxylesterase